MLSQQMLSTEVMMFFTVSCSRLAYSKVYCQKNLGKNLYFVVLKNIFDEVIVHFEQRFKTMIELRFVELMNLQLFHTYQKIFLMEVF